MPPVSRSSGGTLSLCCAAACAPGRSVSHRSGLAAGCSSGMGCLRVPHSLTPRMTGWDVVKDRGNAEASSVCEEDYDSVPRWCSCLASVKLFASRTTYPQRREHCTLAPTRSPGCDAHLRKQRARSPKAECAPSWAVWKEKQSTETCAEKQE